MEYDINNYLKISYKKDGRIVLVYDVAKEANIYSQLKEMGYCYSTINGKKTYYRRFEGEVSSTKMLSIKHAFRDFLENTDFKNRPATLKHEDIMQWFYAKNPVRENGLLKFILQDELSKDEEHQIKFQTDTSYKHNFEINQVLCFLEEFNFKKKANQDTITHNSDLYYKNIGDNEFIIFTHFCIGKTFYSGFDTWRAKYINERQIGKIEPETLDTIRLSFNLKRDYPLVQNLLERT